MATSSFYVGPRQSRIRLDSWDDVVLAAESGVLDETQWVELKEAIPASSKEANRKLAEDLASLSIDGGILVIGVVDASSRAGEVVGTELVSFETRIDQVAGGTIHPPLQVTLDQLVSPDRPGHGVVVVTVPASAGAPHMVGGRYWGRGATGKRQLSDDEVRRLLADRQGRAAGFEDRLRAVPSRLDVPLFQPGTDRGRLYVLLEPAAAASAPVTDLLGEIHPTQLSLDALGFPPQGSPSFRGLNFRVAHPDGFAAATHTPGDEVVSGRRYLGVLYADDGSVLMSAPAVREHKPAPGDPPALSGVTVLEQVHSSCRVAAHLATEYTGYQGPWRVGLLATGLRGTVASQAYSDYDLGPFAPFPADEHLHCVDTTTRELSELTSAVVCRLMKRLLRGYGIDTLLLPYSEPGDLGRRR